MSPFPNVGGMFAWCGEKIDRIITLLESIATKLDELITLYKQGKGP
jgi:exonuclease VII small subunit